MDARSALSLLLPSAPDPQGGLHLSFWLTAKLKMPQCIVQAKAVGPKPKAPAKAPPAGPAQPGAAAQRKKQVTQCLCRHLPCLYIHRAREKLWPAQPDDVESGPHEDPLS